jgi:carboxylesterase type B
VRANAVSVEWVHKNIAQFGGDPDRIVLWGQSAGGGSVANYPFAFPEDPIVKGLIADSGAGITSTNPVPYANFTFLAGLVGCGDRSPQDELHCVRQIDAVTLVSTLSNYTISGNIPSIAFTPAADGVTVFTNTTERLLQGQLAPLVSQAMHPHE